MAEHPFAPATEEEALAAIRHIQWPSGEPTCPRCGSTHTRLDRARYRHGRCVRYCRDCRRTFTDLTATPMFNSQTPLTLWIAAILYYPRLPAGRLAQALGLSHCRAAHIRRQMAAYPDFCRELRDHLWPDAPEPWSADLCPFPPSPSQAMLERYYLSRIDWPAAAP